MYDDMEIIFKYLITSNFYICLSDKREGNELECFISSETGASAQETVYLSDARRCREVFSGV